MGETLGGGVEIECWREVVPVLLHETRRLTVHIQFRSIKFSVLRREFHIKLSSEEDHCFLYKAAVTQDVYQRFAHYHNLDVPFEHFPEYMHHLMHSVKNNHEYGDRFFISILAPQTIANVPHSIEFIVTQRQLGCVVQCRRLSLNFSLASDNELKEHLINGFERFKRDKDMVQRRCIDVEAELANERLRVRELEEKNRYLQRELEFSQTLLKSAETLQKHYESLLKQQQCGYKPSAYNNSFHTVDNAQSDVVVDSAASTNHSVPLLPPGHFSDGAASANFQHSHAASYPSLHPADSHVGPHHRRPTTAASTTSVHVMGMSVYLDSVSLEPSAAPSTCAAAAHLLHSSSKVQLEDNQQQQTHPSRHAAAVPQRKDASVVAPPAFHLLTGNGTQQQPSPLSALLTCAAFETSSSSSSSLHAVLAPLADDDVKRTIDTSHLYVAQSARHPDSTLNSRQCAEAADSKKLTGAAKRKASFHNLTSTNPVSAATHGAAEPRQNAAASASGKQGVDPCDAPHVGSHLMTNRAAASAVDHQHQQHFCVAATPMALSNDDQQVVSMDDDSHTAAATLASMPHHLNGLIDEGNVDVENFCNSSSAAAVSLVPFLEAGALHGFLPDDLDANGAVMSPDLGPTNADAELMDSLADLNDADWRSMKVDDFDQSAGTVVVSSSPSSATVRVDDASKPSPSMDGVLSYLKCLICDRSFDLGSAHMAQHVTQARTCSVCGDSPVFESKEELVKHMLSHSARIYACQYCGKENPRIHYLKIHVRSHTGEKPYTCHQCGRGFADASTWRRHERVHTGEKPFQCNICGRKIARRDNVKIHMKSHMRTKQHHAACRICGKHFTQPHHLMLHERVCSPMSSSCDEKLAADTFCLGDNKSSNF